MKNKEIEEFIKHYDELSRNKDIVANIDKDFFFTFADETIEYIKQLENKVKELGKGQYTLMQSRRKWKNRYYKERRKRKEADESVWQIYLDYQDIGKMYFDLDEKRQQAVESLIKIKENIQNILNVLEDKK